MSLKTLSSINVKNKTVLLRTDINSPYKNRKILNNPRFQASLKTIKELKRKKAKVVIIAHQSRPGKKDFVSLKQHSKFLKVKFIPDIIESKAQQEIKSLSPGKAILLENIRFNKDELSPKKNNKLAKTLSNLCDIYIN
ncbi:MAG: phosphoglycerate kinase, partial [Nanoarchaeota archaeon]|nr:phosphoglycerate kinase [Nanoarchaeota archaeon]